MEINDCLITQLNYILKILTTYHNEVENKIFPKCVFLFYFFPQNSDGTFKNKYITIECCKLYSCKHQIKHI